MSGYCIACQEKPQPPRVVVVGLASCFGCQLQITNVEEHLLDVLGQIDLRYWQLTSSEPMPEAFDVAVIEGAVIKLLGLDAAINGKQKSRMENGLHTILDAVDRGVMGATNGLMDGKMLAGTALSVLAIKEWRLAGLAVPGAMTLLWWAARLFGGNRL